MKTNSASANSTNVRLSQCAIRGAFRALEFAAPSIGARWAEKFWFTMPLARLETTAPGGTAFEVQSQGATVRGLSWGSGPVVYLVHGWGGNATQLAKLVPPLVSAGFTVVAHDAPSHGSSDPGRHPGSSDAMEMGHALDDVAAVFGPAHAVVAHSMGGVATGFALKNGWLGTDRLVLVAPMVRLSDHLPLLQVGLGFGPRTLTRLEERSVRRVGVRVEEADLLRIAQDIDRPDVLVIHDRDDREAPMARAEELVAHWPGARMTATQGLGHRRILRDDAVVRQVVAYVSSAEQVERSA